MDESMRLFVEAVKHKKISAIADGGANISNWIIDEYHYHGNRPKNSNDSLSVVPYMMIGVDLANVPDMTSYRDEQGNVTFKVNDSTPPIQS